MVTMNSANIGRPEEWVLGCSVRLLTTLGEVIEGTIFSYDRTSDYLTLTNEGREPGTLDFRVFKASYVQSILSAKRPDAPFEMRLPPLDLRNHSRTPEPRQKEELQVERVTSWEDEVAREEEEETKQRRPEEIQEPEPVQNEPEERIRTPEPEKRQPTSRPNPWGRKLDTEPKKEPPIVSTYASVSKGKERTPPPSPPPVSATAPQPTPKGVWGGKNPRVKAYSQVAASNANTAQSTQPETKSGKVGMVTMSLPTRTVSRN